MPLCSMFVLEPQQAMYQLEFISVRDFKLQNLCFCLQINPHMMEMSLMEDEILVLNFLSVWG